MGEATTPDKSKIVDKLNVFCNKFKFSFTEARIRKVSNGYQIYLYAESSKAGDLIEQCSEGDYANMKAALKTAGLKFVKVNRGFFNREIEMVIA